MISPVTAELVRQSLADLSGMIAGSSGFSSCSVRSLAIGRDLRAISIWPRGLKSVDSLPVDGH
jgi:hypothetical protein